MTSVHFKLFLYTVTNAQLIVNYYSYYSVTIVNIFEIGQFVRK